MILGIDEVGRGPWAGPLVVGAVVLGGVEIKDLTDSKKLSKKKREKLDMEIREKAIGIGLGWVSAIEIDEIGLSRLLVLATKRAVSQINVSYHEIIIDGTINFLSETNKGKYVTTMKKADLLVPCVSAASIVAKVARDGYMAVQDKIYPGYGFKRHVGYGTAAHVAAIDELGVTPLHRLSFAPLNKYNKKHTCSTTSKNIGDAGEDKASEYLLGLGHKILDRNWKTKYCEIDIVSLKDDTLYFTEVKYRKNINFGDGIEAITKKKLNKMKFSANLYVSKNKITDTNMLLTAISLDGDPPVVTEFIEV